MVDIVDKLSKYAAGMGTRNPDDYAAFLTVSEANEAAETINKLRQALYKIGYDYVEFSHDKVQLLYLEHIKIAKEAYQNSFPESSPTPFKPLDNNF